MSTRFLQPDENMEVHNSYVPYGIGNLMGEVGGTLGNVCFKKMMTHLLCIQ